MIQENYSTPDHPNQNLQLAQIFANCIHRPTDQISSAVHILDTLISDTHYQPKEDEGFVPLENPIEALSLFVDKLSQIPVNNIDINSMLKGLFYINPAQIEIEVCDGKVETQIDNFPPILFANVVNTNQFYLPLRFDEHPEFYYDLVAVISNPEDHFTIYMKKTNSIWYYFNDLNSDFVRADFVYKLTRKEERVFLCVYQQRQCIIQ